MRYLCNDPAAEGFEHLRVHYANTPLPDPLPHDSGLVMLNVEEKAKTPGGSLVNIHYATRADNPVKMWRQWAVDIIKARAAAIGCPVWGMYSTPTCASYFENCTSQKRAEIVAYMAQTEQMMGSSALFVSDYDAWADADGIPTPQEVGNEVARVRSAMQWACAVREVTGLPVYSVVHEREKDTTTTPGKWLGAGEYWPVLEEIAKHQPHGVVHWSNTAFVDYCWHPKQDKRDGYRDWYMLHVKSLPTFYEGCSWDDEPSQHIKSMLHGLAGIRSAQFRAAIKSIFGASSAPSNEGGNQ